MDELEAIVERAKSGPLCEADRETLRAAFQTLFALTNELEAKGASIRRLRKLLFGSSSEKLDEVLRQIANNRLWTRNYKVKLALATNPKTPQPTAMKFVNFLQDNDLRTIVKSKDVPTAISTHARRILMKKGKI